MPTDMFNKYRKVFLNWEAFLGWKQSEEDAPPSLSSYDDKEQYRVAVYLLTKLHSNLMPDNLQFSVHHVVNMELINECSCLISFTCMSKLSQDGQSMTWLI